MMKEKSQVMDIDRSIYDIKDVENDAYRIKSGLTPEIIEKISKEKNDPIWMQQFRLQALQIYNEIPTPDWGPSLEGLDMDNIATYVRPNTKMQNNWKNVPQDIKDTFERLGIPQAERKSLAGVGAQYDSELVYHNVRSEVAQEGVVLHGYRKCHERRICRYGEKIFHEACYTEGSQICGFAWCSMVGRLVCVCA